MKKVVSILITVFALTLLLGLFAGCAYRTPSNRCIVALPQRVRLYSADGKECQYIDKEIKGIEQQWDKLYYSVVKNAEYTITSEYIMFPYQGSNPGRGINGEHWVPAYWQGFLIRSLTKTYGENSNLQDEVIFTSNLKETSASITVSFSENCIVQAVSQEYLNVGGILEVVKKGDVPSGNVDDYLNADGSVKERAGLHYLLLKNEVCAHQDAWATNLEIVDYDYNNLKDYGTAIQARFTAKPLVIGDDEEVLLHVVCRTSDGDYFIYSTALAESQGFSMPVREHELKLTFSQSEILL